ncbi:MAG: 4-(cytidine 5'-diphospho)-2-C-methyl-D-erythritol kinase [Victivallales bacterium]|nr:4-(cytidine 5'-diphospho)-2-C-methyl-D-erythritol kinase [Victivallales bacterium]
MKAVAKTNLYLRVLGERHDAYHELENVFVPVSGLYDDVELLPGENGVLLHIEGEAVPSDQDNLCLKAAEAFCSASGLKPQWTILLRKRIPVAAGLGGGASDAAAVLLLLNEHYGNPLEKAKLAELASSLGADVPFFLKPEPALGTGIGDVLRPICLNVHFALLVVTPCFPVPVKWTYAHLPSALPEEPRLDDFLASAKGDDIYSFARMCRNDLEEPVFKKFPLLCAMRDCLMENGALAVHVSGSGPSLFAIAETAKAQAIAERFHEKYHTFKPPVVACF